MAMNAKEAHEMVELATKKSHLVTQLVPSPYTLKYDQTIRNLIQNKFFGQLLAIDIRSVVIIAKKNVVNFKVRFVYGQFCITSLEARH
jgi:predicted dehydrogenase